MSKATKKNQAIMATMPAELNISLLTVSRATEEISVNINHESARVLVWETQRHFDARIKASRAKDATERDKEDAMALREERKVFIAFIPYAGNVRKCNADITRAINDFVGKKGSPRYVAFDRVYDAYVRETESMAMDRHETVAELAGLLHTVVKTDKVSERLLATRIVPCLGAREAGKGDIKNGNKSGIRVMKRAEFIKMVMHCLYALAKTGKCSELFSA